MKYPFRVYQMCVDEDVFWVAESTQISECIAQGETIEEAIHMLGENEKVWLKMAKEYGIPIPQVNSESADSLSAYSGKFTTRVSSRVHRDAVEISKEQGISLNQYVGDALVAWNVQQGILKYIESNFKNYIEEMKDMVTIHTKYSEGLIYSSRNIAKSYKSAKS